jgi:ATP phosphoribosyltransferase
MTHGCRWFKNAGFEHVVLLSADGALEAAPAMGAADIILDLVSTGVTLRENNLKELQGGNILEVCMWPTRARAARASFFGSTSLRACTAGSLARHDACIRSLGGSAAPMQAVDLRAFRIQSEGVLVGNRRSLLERRGLLPMVHELLERLEAHLTADKFYSVTVNMRGDDPRAIAADMRAAGIGGLQGPTISKVRFAHVLAAA